MKIIIQNTMIWWTGGVLHDELVSRKERALQEVVHSYKKTKWMPFVNLRYVAYIPYAAGLVVSDALNLNAHTAFLISELTNS